MKSHGKHNKHPRRCGQISEILRRNIFIYSLAFLSACSGESPNPKTPSGDPQLATAQSSQRLLRRGIPGEPRTLDPQLADDEFSFPVIRDLFEGLTTEGPNGEVKPGVAESWEIDR